MIDNYMNKCVLKAVIFATIFIVFSTKINGQIGLKKITVSDKTTSVINICQFLQNDYHVKIAFGNNDPQLQRQINVVAGTFTLSDFLNIIFRKNAINYQLTDEQLIIVPLVKKNEITISGFVEDSETGEKLPGANIYIPSLQKGTTTNNYGFFTITLNDPVSDLLVSYTGYELYQSQTGFDEDTRITIKLKLNKNLEEIVITSNTTKSVPLQQQTQMSKISVPTSVIKNMPRFLGEADLLKTLQLLPGVSQGSEATSGLLVRGGSPDQNLILLDGTPVYNPSHLFGIFSAFNSNALKSVDIYKGGFPARFGSRLSSVVDIVTKDGNMKEIHGEGSVGFVAANFTLEGPLKKDKTSFLISGRRTYADFIVAPLIKSSDENIKKFVSYFYDVNLKLHHIISPKDRLFLSFYKGDDMIKLRMEYINDNPNANYDYSEEEKFKGGWGNVLGTIRWNHIFNKKLFANTLINYTQYRLVSDYNSDWLENGVENRLLLGYFSGIHDIGARMDFDYRPIPEHSIRFGASGLQHVFKPGVLAAKSGNTQAPDIDTSFNSANQNSAEFSLYAEDEWKVSPKLKINAGIHSNAFKANTKFYYSAQPRIAMRYMLPKDIAFKVSYTHMNQYIHLLANNSITLPTDLWVPSTDKIKPMLSRQVAIGLAKSVSNNKVDISLEGYYKTMDGVIEYKEGVSYLNSSLEAWDTKVESGKGKVWGVELLVQKNVGKTKGWIGYTLSHNSRVFANLNNGKPFDYKYDRRHDFEIAVTHTFNSRCEISGSWQFQTAVPFTVPVAQYEEIEDGSPYNNDNGIGHVNHIKGRNQFRLVNYHRLDIGITWRKRKKHYERMWNVGLYNAYNRMNPFYYYLDETNSQNTSKIIGLTILPILPSITYGIKF